MMKRIVLLTAVLWATGAMVMAQGGPRGGQRNVNPETRAERMTERMVKEYSLNDKQKKEVYEVNLEMSRKMALHQDNNQNKNKELKQDKKDKKDKRERGQNRVSKEDREKRQADMKAAQEARDAKLKKIFTKEQYEAYTKNQADRQKRMNEGGGQRAPRGPKTAN